MTENSIRTSTLSFSNHSLPYLEEHRSNDKDLGPYLDDTLKISKRDMGLAALLRSETCIPNELNFSIGLVGAMLMRYSDDAMPCSKAVNVTSHNWRGD